MNALDRRSSPQSILLLVLGALVLGAAAMAAWLVSDRPAGTQPLPGQHQSADRVREIAAIEVQRQGSVSIAAIPLSATAMRGPRSTHRLVLRSPSSTVRDTDIRGLVDGNGKYVFNQGTAYHMRIGRRFGGARSGEFELKRSLVRWNLPRLPVGTRVTFARAVFWVEAHGVSSPMARGETRVPLHVFAYPVGPRWNEGHGGVGRDDFSAPVAGEVTWMDARSGELAWPAPGALGIGDDPRRGYVTTPVALGKVSAGDTTLVLEGPRLAELVQASLHTGAIDLLLKLEDAEEDRWGTEIAVLTSDFGTDLDFPSKRPTLELEFEIRVQPHAIRSAFVLEPGTEEVLHGIRRSDTGPILFDVEWEQDLGQIPPTLMIRGGDSEDAVGSWLQLVDGLVADWSWWQAKIITGGERVTPGDTFALQLHATWVSPGPRAAQVPELALVAPSGETYFVNGVDAPGLRYRMAFVPTELGLWRFGWSFRPTEDHPPDSQQGQGTFFVGLAGGPSDSVSLALMAVEVERARASESPFSDRRQYLLNSFLRAAAHHRVRYPGAHVWLESLIDDVRGLEP